MADVQWHVSGVDGRRWRIQHASLWRPPVSVRRAVTEVPGRHGSVGGRLPVFAEPTVSLRFHPRGADHGSLEFAVNELTALLSAPDLTLTRVSGDLTSTARAELESVSSDELWPVASMASVTALLVLPGVFLHGPTTTTDLGTVSHGDTVTVPALGAGTAPVTDATLRVRGPATMVRVLDEATDTGIEWSGSLSSSQYLYLHPDTLTARRSTSTSAWTSGGTNVTGGVDYPPAGPLQLWPVMADGDPSVRAVRLRVEGSGFGDTTSLAVRAAPAYL